MSIRLLLPGFALALLPFIFGCREGDGNSAPAPAPPATEAGEAEPGVVLFLGTSLTAGPGIDPDQTYPALVQEKIDSAGLPYRTVNAGVSGETSAGALRRLEWLLRQPFDVLVLETGANDMLRGGEPDSVRANLLSIIRRVRAERPDARIVLVGMLAVRNLGREYVEEFDSLYPRVARENDLAFVPFLLEGVAGDPALNLPDGIHPNEAGHRRLAQTVWKMLEPVLRRGGAPGEAGS
jgi:acyl-CoA thioesterase-1